jgi:hypothetical protein
VEKLKFNLCVDDEVLEARIPEGFYTIFGNLFRGFEIYAHLDGKSIGNLGKFRDIYVALDKANEHCQIPPLQGRGLEGVGHAKSETTSQTRD